MTPADETLAIVKRIGPVILSAAVDAASETAASLRRCVGMMMADPNMINIQTFCIAFGYAVDLAKQCGATLVTMDRVRKAALTEMPVNLSAVLTVTAIIRLTLACEARIVSLMQFRSRDEVDAIATALNAAFTQTEEIAADDLDANTYMALITLHGDITKHLVEQGRKLPRVITYAFQMVMPALLMAQRSYADPLRSDELIAENSVVHPAFMPRTGKMLAV